MVGTMAAIFAIANPASAFTVKGMGTCHSWRNASQDHFWILGFISGVNAAKSSDIAATISSDEIYDWVDHYCKANPDKDLSDATMAFIRAQ